MDEKYKNQRTGFINGYNAGMLRGTALALTMIAAFVLLLVVNPLHLSYVQVDIVRGDETCKMTVIGSTTYYDCTSPSYAVLYWTYFIGSILIYLSVAMFATTSLFALLFNTKRVMEKMDIVVAARESLGLYKKDEENKQ